jgi:hypothetical protein
MYTINSTKHEITLQAISIDDKLNVKKNKNNQTFEKGNIIYWVMDKNNYEPSVFSRAMLRFFETHKKEINVDVDSFLKLVATNHHQGLITSLLSTSELFNDRLSYKTSKQTKTINNFIIHNHDQQMALAKILVDAES